MALWELSLSLIQQDKKKTKPFSYKIILMLLVKDNT